MVHVDSSQHVPSSPLPYDPTLTLAPTAVCLYWSHTQLCALESLQAQLLSTKLHRGFQNLFCLSVPRSNPQPLSPISHIHPFNAHVEPGWGPDMPSTQDSEATPLFGSLVWPQGLA